MIQFTVPTLSYCRRFNALPHPHRLVNYDHEGGDDEGSGNNDSTSNTSGLDETYNARQHKAWDQNSEQMFEQNVTWEDVGWLKANACPHLPLIIKGIMTGEDADLAMSAGADGVMVSNHGGRQLDGALATIDVLPEVVAAVRQRGPVLLDGGVRRGTDVLKALALGATAVGIGKPVFFALAVGGESAVRRMLGLFRTEIEAAMAICGCETVDDITSSLVSRHQLHLRASL
jgi:isopentenyl diphosphate isomerase/L-lactate dehydrogenase-like FMN-dependent dehydrogenase